MAKLLFNATREQIQKAAALAADKANPGPPTSLGWLHFDNTHEFTPDEMKVFWNDKKDEFKADYVQGRCTKFAAWTMKGDFAKAVYGDAVKGYDWMTGYETQEHYETWRNVYPTYADLLKAAGITDYKVFGETL
jgi:hypothetical protein